MYFCQVVQSIIKIYISITILIALTIVIYLYNKYYYYYLVFTTTATIITTNYYLFLVTNGITSQSKVKVKHLKPNQVHKMVACKKPLAIFPKTTKKENNSSVEINEEAISNLENIRIQEELFDDLDEMSEDQINLLNDTELLKTISMTEKDIVNQLKDEEQKIVNIYKNIELPINKEKL